ncbi:RNA-binding protein 7-like [Notothenia coriiceps]|uniref:RNA-binding protein 7-like n=1 Tax=Notothenia coriiceps TaxID=8208 RepID=A0A6I9PFK0_9TELE|nr:PREDICTED: RNA-binding protein 7-like [Notothenia coriiceps]
MGIEDEADRTLFIRNLDSRVTEELLFELFIQAGPLTKTKIPKDADGKQKTFGFAVYKHEVSVPYAMQLLDGTSVHGRTLHVQFRSGSSHGNSPGNSQNTSPANTPNPHGQRRTKVLSEPWLNDCTRALRCACRRAERK